MIRIRTLFAGISLALAGLLTAGSAHAQSAQIAHTWVSSTGGGTACTRAAPCANFRDAYAATAPGGVISVLDSGDYGGLTITKSLTVRAEGIDGGTTAIVNSSGNLIGVAAAATDSVTLEGLRFNGAGGVTFRTGGQLHVVGCVITNANFAGDAGILFAPSGVGKLTVTDTVITNMGNGTGGGIVINPKPGGSAQVALERVTVNGNAFGIAADGSGSTAGINMTIADSMIANNAQDGVVATTPGGGAPIGVMVRNTRLANNSIGLHSVGTGVTVRVSDSTVIGNSTGVSFSGGAALLTFGNNEVQANGVNGAFSGPVALK
jgi:hypothetical protein